MNTNDLIVMLIKLMLKRFLITNINTKIKKKRSVLVQFVRYANC